MKMQVNSGIINFIKSKMFVLDDFYICSGFRKEILEKQKLLNNSKFEETSDKLAKTIHRTNEALEELKNASIKLENVQHKLGYINKYKSNISEAQASLIVIFYIIKKKKKTY